MSDKYLNRNIAVSVFFYKWFLQVKSGLLHRCPALMLTSLFEHSTSRWLMFHLLSICLLGISFSHYGFRLCISGSPRWWWALQLYKDRSCIKGPSCHWGELHTHCDSTETYTREAHDVNTKLPCTSETNWRFCCAGCKVRVCCMCRGQLMHTRTHTNTHSLNRYS